MKRLISAIALCSLSFAQPPKIEGPANAPVTIGANLVHWHKSAALVVTNTSDKSIEWITFHLHNARGDSDERVPVDIRPGDRERVIVQLLNDRASNVLMAGGNLTITAVEFAGGTSWKAPAR